MGCSHKACQDHLLASLDKALSLDAKLVDITEVAHLPALGEEEGGKVPRGGGGGEGGGGCFGGVVSGEGRGGEGVTLVGWVGVTFRDWGSGEK